MNRMTTKKFALQERGSGLETVPTVLRDRRTKGREQEFLQQISFRQQSVFGIRSQTNSLWYKPTYKEATARGACLLLSGD